MSSSRVKDTNCQRPKIKMLKQWYWALLATYGWTPSGSLQQMTKRNCFLNVLQTVKDSSNVMTVISILQQTNWLLTIRSRGVKAVAQCFQMPNSYVGYVIVEKEINSNKNGGTMFSFLLVFLPVFNEGSPLPVMISLIRWHSSIEDRTDPMFFCCRIANANTRKGRLQIRLGGCPQRIIRDSPKVERLEKGFERTVGKT